MRVYIGTTFPCVLAATMAFALAPDSKLLAQFNPAAGAQPGQPAAGALPAANAPNAMFAAIDADGDGVITAKELRKAIVALKQLDTDKDGNITLAEAGGGGQQGAAAGAAGPFSTPEQLVDRMMAGDKNKDGKLSADELPAEMTPQMAQDADADRDGTISRAELLAAMERMQNQAPGGAGFVPGGVGPGGAGGPHGDTSQAAGIFKRYDANGDGKLSTTELPPQMVSALRNADKDGDHMISPVELQEYLIFMGDRARGLGMTGSNNAAPGGPNTGAGNRPGGRNGGRN